MCWKHVQLFYSWADSSAEELLAGFINPYSPSTLVPPPYYDYPQVTIREALQELVAWSQTAELKLVDHEENGRRTPLIRDWSDVFLELGDKQSLLASLKESQFFKAFEDQGITYEVCAAVKT